MKKIIILILIVSSLYCAKAQTNDLPKISVKDNNFVGESSHHIVWLWYVPNAEWLKLNGFTVEDALKLPEPPPGKRNLVFGPMKFMADDAMQDVLPLRKRKIQFLQLPYEIYRMAR